MTTQGRPGMDPAELRERAVRLVREGEAAYGSEWGAICAVAEMLGPTAETVRKWVRRAEIDEGTRPRPDHGRACATQAVGAGEL